MVSHQRAVIFIGCRIPHNISAAGYVGVYSYSSRDSLGSGYNARSKTPPQEMDVSIIIYNSGEMQYEVYTTLVAQ